MYRPILVRQAQTKFILPTILSILPCQHPHNFLIRILYHYHTGLIPLLRFLESKPLTRLTTLLNMFITTLVMILQITFNKPIGLNF